MQSAEVLLGRLQSKHKKAFGLFQEVKSAAKQIQKQDYEFRRTHSKELKAQWDSEQKSTVGIGRSLDNTDTKPKNYYRTTTKKTPLKADVLSTKWDTSYTRDYFSYLRQKELDSIIAMEVCNKMAADENGQWLIIVDWLVDIQKILEYSSNTLYLAVHILKKMAAVRPISDNHLPKFGITALFIASKFEDAVTKCITLHTIEQIAKKQDLCLEDILTCEERILQSNCFKIGMVTNFTFIQKVQCIMKSERNVRALHFMGLLTLYSIKLNSVRGSLVVYCLAGYLKQIAQGKRDLLDDNGDFEHVMEYLDLQLVEEKELSQCKRLLYAVINHVILIDPTAIREGYRELKPLLREV